MYLSPKTESSSNSLVSVLVGLSSALVIQYLCNSAYGVLSPVLYQGIGPCCSNGNKETNRGNLSNRAERLLIRILPMNLLPLIEHRTPPVYPFF